METSGSIAEIGKALAAAQAEMQPAEKNCVNPFFKSKYADLAEVTKALKPMAKHGIAHCENVWMSEAGLNVQVVLIHSSGEWIKFDALVIPVEKDTAQGVVSATTYGRRAALSANTGLAADDDDDGNSVVAPKKAPAKKEAEKPNGSPVELSCSERVAKSKGQLGEDISEKHVDRPAKLLKHIPEAVKAGTLTVEDGEELRSYFVNRLIGRLAAAPKIDVLESWGAYYKQFAVECLPPMMWQRMDEAYLKRKGELLAETATA